MKLPGEHLVALLVAVSFASGLNVYATVLTLGLLAHAHAFTLPGQLQMLSSWWVIGVSAVLFAIEFFGDKIPAFDLMWNALHTFIRVPVSALMAYQAASSLSPGNKLLAALAGGIIAFIAHGGKTAVRAAVTPSPEPVSNIVLSLGEDLLAITLTWLAGVYPYVAGAIGVVLIVVTILLGRWVWRALKSLFRGANRSVRA